MSFEPQKLFIGLIDFFTILMPGAALTYVLQSWALENFIGDARSLSSTETAALFLFASYLLGHFVFLISAILDDWIYDPIRAWSDWGQIKRLANGQKLSRPWKRKLAKSVWLFGGKADDAVVQAQRIKARALWSLEAEDAVNAFQWCKACLLQASNSQAYVAVQRFEADSKFFRSFFVVLAALAVVYACRGQNAATFFCLVGMLLTLWRYIDQRFKSTQQAYWLAITEVAKTAKPESPVPDRDGLTHAGGIVYRRRNGETEFLLITARKARSEWVLPKGHIEPGEAPAITAVREIREETGQWARLIKWLADRPLGDGKDAAMVRWFLLRSCEETAGSRPEGREQKWLRLQSAIDMAKFRETKELLAQADQEIRQILAVANWAPD